MLFRSPQQSGDADIVGERALGRRRAQTGNRHGLIAQKAPETNLGAPTAASNLAHARTGARDKRGMTQGPLFLSRSSPNPPTPYRSTSTALKSITGSRICPSSESEFVKRLKEKMCASDSRLRGEGNAHPFAPRLR